MNPSMINAMHAMNALQQKLDTVANNISNMNTIGYKREDITFHDILTSQKQQHPGKMTPGRSTDLGLTLGWGTQVAKQFVDFSQGSLLPTEVPTDIAIEGNGLIELRIPRLDEFGDAVLDEAGEAVVDRAWTNNGALQLTRLADDPFAAYLATSEGHILHTTDALTVRIPEGHSMLLDAEGNIFSQSNLFPEAEPDWVGQLPIVQVMRPELLENIGEGLFVISQPQANVEDVLRQVVSNEEDPAFDAATMVTFAESGIAVRQGFLEQSNVNLNTEMTDLIAMQRAYQLSARALTSSDMMMGLAVQLRG